MHMQEPYQEECGGDYLVAKALVHSPEIIILDEPTAGVDVDLRNNLWSIH